MARLVAMIVLTAVLVGSTACNSSSAPAEVKQLSGKRIPEAVGKNKGRPPVEKK